MGGQDIENSLIESSAKVCLPTASPERLQNIKNNIQKAFIMDVSDKLLNCYGTLQAYATLSHFGENF